MGFKMSLPDSLIKSGEDKSEIKLPSIIKNKI